MTFVSKASTAARLAALSLAGSVVGVAQAASVGQFSLGTCEIEGKQIAVNVSAVRVSDAFEVKGFTLVDVASGEMATTTTFEDQGASVRTLVADTQGVTTYDLMTYFTIVSETEMKLTALASPISRIEIIKTPGSHAAFGTYAFSLSLDENTECVADVANIDIILD